MDEKTKVKQGLIDSLLGSSHSVDSEGSQVAEGRSGLLMKSIAGLRAKGCPDDQIAALLGLSLDRVLEVTSLDSFVDALLEAQLAFHQSYEERLENMAGVALDRQVRLLHTTKKPELASRISEQLLDRAKGKATQNMNITSKNLNVHSTLEQLEQQEKAIDEQLKVLNRQADLIKD